MKLTIKSNAAAKTRHFQFIFSETCSLWWQSPSPSTFTLFLFALYLSEVETSSTLWSLQLAVMSPVSESPRRAQQTTQPNINHGDQTPTQKRQTSQLNVPQRVLLC